jgi:glycosyltransferase involved in cell wall biosynthesis
MQALSDAPEALAFAAVPAMSGAAANAARPRVAILSTWYPEPIDNGAKLRVRLMIDALAPDFDVLLVVLLGNDDMPEGTLTEVSGVESTHVLPLPTFRPRSVKSLVAAFSAEPRSIAATWDPALARHIAALMDAHQVDVVIGNDMRTIRYLVAIGDDIPTILDEPNVSPFAIEEGAPRRARVRQAKYQRMLARYDAGFDAVSVASTEEAAAYRRLSGRQQVEVLPNGVTTIPATTWTPPAGLQALYTGSLTYAPNAEAVAVWNRDVRPIVARALPDVSLVVTGTLPAVLPADVVHPSIHLTGRLDSLDGVYADARVFIAPIRSGTGTRIKLLEAMARGMPVVTTSKGIEGIAATAGEHALIADDPRDFAGAVVRVLTDDALAARLGAAGRDLVARHYGPGVLGDRLRSIVDAALARRAVQRAVS